MTKASPPAMPAAAASRLAILNVRATRASSFGASIRFGSADRSEARSNHVDLEGGTGFPPCRHPYASTAFVEAHSHLEAPGRFQRYAIGVRIQGVGLA